MYMSDEQRTLMCNFKMITGVTLLLAALVGAVSSEHYHIVPVDSTDLCQHYPNGTCFTLDKLSSQISDTGDITISFLPGEHLLTWNMTFINRNNITLYSKQLCNLSNSAPIIRYVPNTQINVTETDSFTLKGLVLSDCQKKYDNWSTDGGGGAIYLNKTAALIKNCTFENNTAVCKHCDGGALYSIHSDLTIDSCVFSGNSADRGGSGVHIVGETLHITRSTFENNSALCEYSSGGALYSHNSEVTIDSCVFSGNSAEWGGGVYTYNGRVHIMRSTFENNSANLLGGALKLSLSGVVHITDSTFEYNTALTGNGGAVAAKNKGTVTITNSTFSSNQALRGGAISSNRQNKILILDNSLTVRMNNNVAHYGGAMYLERSELQSDGAFITANTAEFAGGGVYAIQSIINLNNTKIHHNTALQDGGGVYLTASSLGVDHLSSCNIDSNTARNFGGGVYLQDKSQLLFNVDSKMLLKNNTAKRGGAIFVSDSDSGQVHCDKVREISELNTIQECFIQPDFIHSDQKPYVHFQNNSAEETGSDIYGGLLDRCIVKTRSRLGIDFIKERAVFSWADKFESISQFYNYISSDPVRVCFCLNDVTDCNYTHPTVLKKKGETFTLSVVAVDQVGKPVNATLVSSLLSRNQRIERLKEGQQRRPVNNLCTELEYNVYSKEPSAALEIYAKGPCSNQGVSKQEVNITFELCTCPIGLEKTSDHIDCSCDCALELKQYISSCSPENGTIQINENVWIEYIDHTNTTTKFATHQCPVGYCENKPVNISLASQTEANRQCAFNRTGRLCGQCEQGLSLVLASSRCWQCPNYYLFLLLPFALAGIALVAFILLLNITVAAGTIHGLIFYANIIAANRSIFLPLDNNFLTVFISWLSLDLGIETCFYNGMDSYGKFLLQLVFPAYVFLLIAIIMVLCNCFKRVMSLFGKKNPEATLYTLILLSYSKLIHLIIAALQKAHIDYPDSQKIFWLYDANIPYFSSSHIPRFLAAFIIAVLGAVYTTLLLFGQLFNCCSEYRLMKWTANKYYIHFLKAHHALLSDKHRYWVGLLLLARLVHYLISAFSNNSTTILSVCSLTILLLLLKTRNRIYNNWLLDILETIFIINLNILAVANSVLNTIKPETQGNQQALATASMSVSFITFLGIVLYHILDSCGVKLGKLPNIILTALRGCRHNQPVVVIEEKEADNYKLLDLHNDDQLREPALDDLIPVQPEDYNRSPTPPPQYKEPTFTEIDIRATQNTPM